MMGQIRKIQKNKKERMEERKRRDSFLHELGGSHTSVFSISQSRTPLGYRPCATLPQERIHLYGKLPYDNVIVGSNGR